MRGRNFWVNDLFNYTNVREAAALMGWNRMTEGGAALRMAFVGSCEVIHVGVSGFLGWGYSFMWLNQMLWGEGEDFALCGKWWPVWRGRGAPVLFVKTRPSHSILPLPQEPGLQADLWPADWIGWLGWQQVLGLSLVSSAGDCLVKPQPQLVVQLAFAIVRAYQTPSLVLGSDRTKPVRSKACFGLWAPNQPRALILYSAIFSEHFLPCDTLRFCITGSITTL